MLMGFYASRGSRGINVGKIPEILHVGLVLALQHRDGIDYLMQTKILG